MKAEKVSAINNSSQFQIQSGTIDAIDQKGYIIQAQNGHHHASRAFSCIVEPEIADTVMFSIDERLQCHILSILERPQDQKTHLDFPGDVTLNASNGQMQLNASQELNISTEKEMNLMSEEMSLISRKALFNIESLRAIGSTLVSRINNVQTFASSLETVAEHWLQKLKNSFRQVDGVDQFKARDSIHTVQNLYSMRSKQAAILAKQDIKMDAERIHMG